MKKFDPNEKSVPAWVATIIIIFLLAVLIFMIVLTVGIIFRQPVSLPSYMLPHLVIAGFLQRGDSHYKMNAVEHKNLLRRRDRATVRLFRGIIIVTVILGLLFLFLSSSGG